jgi:hypothetical protein
MIPTGIATAAAAKRDKNRKAPGDVLTLLVLWRL